MEQITYFITFAKLLDTTVHNDICMNEATEVARHYMDALLDNDAKTDEILAILKPDEYEAKANNLATHATEMFAVTSTPEARGLYEKFQAQKKRLDKFETEDMTAFMERLMGMRKHFEQCRLGGWECEAQCLTYEGVNNI